MRIILTVARREITRLKSRFSGKSRAIVFGVLALTIISSFVLYHQDLAVSKGIYTIGASPESSSIEDSRFRVVVLRPEAGYKALEDGLIDLYLDGGEMLAIGERGGHAVSALTKYLQKQELLTIAGEYEIEEAFPLRIRVATVDAVSEGLVAAAEDNNDINTAGFEPGIVPDGPPILIPEEEPVTGPGTDATVTPSDAVPDISATPDESQDKDDVIAAITKDLESGTPSAEDGTVVAGGVSSATNDAVRQQLVEFAERGSLPEFKAEFIAENDIIIPSLMNPPIPLAQVIITFFYVVPVFFISLFFTSSFTEEKISRKLLILLSAPVTRLQVILGKMAPYLVYSILVIIGVTLAMGGNVLLGLAIFTPVMLFIFAIYLMVALTYRTFKDQTFFSVLALSVVTVYLVGPAMFTGVNDLSYISPLTLAVEMYRGESFTISQYFLATSPLLLVFGGTMYVGTRVLNEEYLMGFRPLHRKVAEAIYATLDRAHINISIFIMGMAFVPVVFMAELAAVALVTNLPVPFMLGGMMIVSVVIEEIAKSVSIVILAQNRALKGVKEALRLGVLSAIGFMLMEKLVLYVVLSVVDDSLFLRALSDGGMLVLPLILHVVSTTFVCFLTAKFGTRYYPLGLLVGSLVHLAYNLAIVGTAL